MFLIRAATPAGPGPTCRLCWMYLFGLTYANGTGSLVSSDFRRSMTCCLRLGGMGPPGQVLIAIMDHLVRYLQASAVNGAIMLRWDDENCSPEKMSSTKRFPSFGSMAFPRRVFRTLSRPRGCANPAYMQSSKTKRTSLSRAYANILTC